MVSTVLLAADVPWFRRAALVKGKKQSIQIGRNVASRRGRARTCGGIEPSVANVAEGR
jgi:hypothetical protein